MSDLQISLLVIGGFMIAGVYLFNWWQERRFRRRTEHAFSREHEDVLLQNAPTQDAARDERVEPKMQIQPAAAAAARPNLGTSATTTIDPAVDYVVEVALQSAADGADLHEEMLSLAASWNKPVQVAGYDPGSGEWREAGIGSDRQYSQLRFAVQMANRAGCVAQDQLTAFRDVVLKWAARNQGEAKCPNVAEAHATALQLDRFCATVDIAIGINVMARDGNSFSGTKIRSLAESAGLILGPNGVFNAQGVHGDILFTLENHEPMPFAQEQMKTLFTGGITFLLDVPRVDAASHAFDTLLEIARSFTAALDGVLVDDNRSALSDGAIEKIRRQLDGVLAKMEAGQIAAGSARALRLFS
jgi:FtsZ-interacting cell division protein ZipA